ncbi:DUF6551 family protein [Mycolicibacterium sp. F2034L]|uniref:DUF6551 family protein n=1 Tax=Mycolicibacterium sp. F2034L TaxID=2926422 RepID=UPI001FF459BD|nr:DUF6551 family protein [Mycolicibacterium sp. F2034L]MCK0174780.1 hypothetical protein [Mycolicibacterium sp. F2034L]
MTDDDVYITTLHVDEIFVDDTYQRPVDAPRAKMMAAVWDRRLAGILEVSDRGHNNTPRYAVVDGQHRWAAAGIVNDGRALVANVHSGLTVADEAKLFDRLNRDRRRPSTWDHWRARIAAGDDSVVTINRVVEHAGLRIDYAPKDGNVRCTSTLEKLAKLGGPDLIRDTLNLILDVWGRRLDAFDAPIVHGVGLVLHFLQEAIDHARLAESLLDIMPRQLKTQALALRDMTTGAQPVLVAIAIMSLYNRRPGRKILVSNRTFGGGSVNAHSVKTAS